MSKENPTHAQELASSLEKKRKELIKAKDFEALKTIFDPNIIYVHSTGGTDSFDTYFDKLKSGSLVYLDVDYVDLSGTLFGETLIVTGKMNAELILSKEQKTVSSIYMSTWIKQQKGDWRMCAHQGAPRLP